MIRDQAIVGSYVGGSLSDLESKLGKQLAVVNQFFTWGDNFSSFMSSTGSRIPLVTIEPWDYTPASVAQGNADSYLNQALGWCKSYGKPVYIRPFHEANGDWYPWSVQNGQEQTFKQAWSRMAGILKQASNVRLIFCPNADTVNRAEPENFWPSPVDVIGIDGYNWNGNSFESIFANRYGKLTALGSQDVWICETACGENVGSSTKASWINAMFQSTKFPRIKGICWFSVNKEKDWRIDSSQASLDAFKSNLTNVTPPDPNNPPDPNTPPSGTGTLTVGAPQPDKTSYAAGATLNAKETFTAKDGDVAVKRAVITVRAPGSTHAGGPFYDLSPDKQNVTVKSGQTMEVSGSITLPADAKTGTWEIYATWCDANDAWHDGPSSSFAVGGDAPPAPSTGIKAGDRVKVMNQNSRFYGKTGTVRSVNTDRGTAMVRLGGETTARMFYLKDIKKI